MIFLDAHVVVWLYAGLSDKLSTKATTLINNNDLYISQMVRLELQTLFEIERITVPADTIIKELQHSLGLTVHDMPADKVFTQALSQNWTRDVFDRLITAEAASLKYPLVSKDKMILANYDLAVW